MKRSIWCFALSIAVLIVLPGFAEDSIALPSDSAAHVDSVALKSVHPAFSCLGADSLAHAIMQAQDSSQCVVPLWKALGEQNASWKKLRKVLPEKQPDALLRIYGVKKLSADEQKRTFFSKKTKNSATCLALLDTLGAQTFTGKDWLKKPSVWETENFGCKHLAQSRLLPLFEAAILDTNVRRAKMISVFPDVWFTRYAQVSSDEEKVRYATSPSLTDTTNCKYVDYANAAQLLNAGIPENACKPYIQDRFGATILRLNFRKNYKPAQMNVIRKRLAGLTTAKLNDYKGLLDSLNTIMGDGESWAALDSLEAIVLRTLQKTPEAIRYFKEPTVPMLSTALNAKVSLLCDFPDINDRMLAKLLTDRVATEQALPSPEELQTLQACLKPELAEALLRMVQQLSH